MSRGKSAGKSEEREFLSMMAKKGKQAHVTRLLDASDIRGLTGGTTSLNHRNPSDFVVTEAALVPSMAYAEVKSTVDPLAFRFNLLTEYQEKSAKRILQAGGFYRVYVKSLAHNIWFRVPFPLIDEYTTLGFRSISWIKLKEMGHQI